MLLLVFALLSTPQACAEIKQQCRACPTDGKQGCSSVGIACQPIRRLCQPAASPVRKAHGAADRKLRQS